MNPLLPLSFSIASLAASPSIPPAVVRSIAFPAAATAEQVDIHRDDYGVPFVFAVTDKGAYFGAGYAAAEDRLFQMCLARLRYQGRLSEFFGPGSNAPPGCPPVTERNVDTDLHARISGFSREPEREAAALAVNDSITYGLLEAYTEGVNRAIQDVQNGNLSKHRLFTSANWLPAPQGTWDIPIEPWTVADCIGVWNVLGGHYDVAAALELGNAARLANALAQNPNATPEDLALAVLGLGKCDDQATVIEEADKGPLMTHVDAYVNLHGLPLTPPTVCTNGTLPHLSHTWAVRASRMTNNKAVIVSEPRVGLTIPATFYEWRMTSSAGGLNVRGMGVPGSPNMLVGATAHVAWGATALGLDQSDLFEIRVNIPGGTYELDGQNRNFEIVDLTDPILVRDMTTGGFLPSRPAHYRECWWGPVVTEILGTTKHYALKAIPLSPGHGVASAQQQPISTTAALRLVYKAQNVTAMRDALGTWAVPSVGLVFADSAGDIGFLSTGAHPVRTPTHFMAGFVPMDGRVSTTDWIGLLPNLAKPWVINPASGWVFSANQTPAGSWYNLVHHWGGYGDNDRSRRLRERLTALFPDSSAKATPFQIEDIRRDVVVPNLRDAVALAQHARSVNGFDFSAEADLALDQLEPWLAAGAKMDGSHPASTLAWFIDGKIAKAHALVGVYGAGGSGIAYMYKKRLIDLQQPGFVLPVIECQLLDEFLREAWACATGDTANCPQASASCNTPEIPPPNTTPAQWPAWYATHIESRALTPYAGLGPIDPFTGPDSVEGPALAGHPGTIVSSLGACYSYWLQMGNLSSFKSRLPLGESDRGPHATDQRTIWLDNDLKGLTAGTPPGAPKTLTYP